MLFYDKNNFELFLETNIQDLNQGNLSLVVAVTQTYPHHFNINIITKYDILLVLDDNIENL